MDILKDKSTELYDYLSRYSGAYYYYNTEDNKYMYGLTEQLSDQTSYITIPVEQNFTLDYLANKYYGRPDYFWVIADFNRIQDPFIDLYLTFTTIKIPSLGSIQYEESIRFNA